MYANGDSATGSVTEKQMSLPRCDIKCLIPHSEESGNYILHYSSVKFTPLKMCPGNKPIKLLQIPWSSNYIYRLGRIPYTVGLSGVHKKYCRKSKTIIT